MKRILSLILIPIIICAQAIDKNNVSRDTSYTISSTEKKILKGFPNATLVSFDNTSSVKTQNDIVYKKINNRSLKLDVYSPDKIKNKLPVIILIHGGGWRSGDKSMEKFNGINLAKNNFIAVAIEYRLSPEAIYPAANEDIIDAIDWVKKNSSKLKIDKNKIALMGESSGGHLASLVGIKYNSNLKSKESNIKAVVNLDGVLDMTTPTESGKDTVPSKPSAAKQWIGYLYKDNPGLWREVSPVNYIDEKSPAFLFINSSLPRFHAGRDETIAKLNLFNIYSEVHTIENTPHSFWFFHPWFDESFNYINDFLQQTLNKKETKKENLSWSKRIAASFIKMNPDYIVYDVNPTIQKWNYEQGLMLNAIRQMYYHTKEKKYLDYIKKNLDQNVKDDGSITTYKVDEFNIDQIGPGRALVFIYDETKLTKYKKAADLLFHQLQNHPRTKSGGFWHKQIYPWQMWLDGLYMGEPFYSEYSKTFNQLKNFDDITKQFTLIYEHTYDSKTGLLYHAWDESKSQKWADKETGQSPHFWGRAIGWYLMAIVDVLDYLPKNHPKREFLLDKLKSLSATILKYRDQNSKCWYQIVDLPNRTPNYLEASATCMYVYSFTKGANKGYLNKEYLNYAKESWNGILKEFVHIDENGLINLEKTCQGAGLGGNPYRDGSFEYYMSEKVRTNDYKGYGPFLLSAIELERAGLLK